MNLDKNSYDEREPSLHAERAALIGWMLVISIMGMLSVFGHPSAQQWSTLLLFVAAFIMQFSTYARHLFWDMKLG
jgi:hypothetical protein